MLDGFKERLEVFLTAYAPREYSNELIHVNVHDGRRVVGVQQTQRDHCLMLCLRLLPCGAAVGLLVHRPTKAHRFKDDRRAVDPRAQVLAEPHGRDADAVNVIVAHLTARIEERLLPLFRGDGFPIEPIPPHLR